MDKTVQFSKIDKDVEKDMQSDSSSSEFSESRDVGVGEQRRRELADFLRTRREKLKPEQVGLTQGSRRRTPGLRREEVAELAGVGTTWYTWLEQARDIQPSAEVLRRLGEALMLNAAEVRHVFALAGKAPPMELSTTEEVVSESLKRFLHESLQVPAILLGSRWDILASNRQAELMLPGIESLPPQFKNWLYVVFCSSESREHLDSWEIHARRLLAEFRASLGDVLDHPWVLEVVDLMKTESPEFTTWWREHDVRDNSPILLKIKDRDGRWQSWERFVIKPGEQSRYRILTFNPHQPALG